MTDTKSKKREEKTEQLFFFFFYSGSLNLKIRIRTTVSHKTQNKRPFETNPSSDLPNLCGSLDVVEKHKCILGSFRAAGYFAPETISSKGCLFVELHWLSMDR